jgi:hypothetical protein
MAYPENNYRSPLTPEDFRKAYTGLNPRKNHILREGIKLESTPIEPKSWVDSILEKVRRIVSK